VNTYVNSLSWKCRVLPNHAPNSEILHLCGSIVVEEKKKTLLNNGFSFCNPSIYILVAWVKKLQPNYGHFPCIKFLRDFIVEEENLFLLCLVLSKWFPICNCALHMNLSIDNPFGKQIVWDAFFFDSMGCCCKLLWLKAIPNIWFELPWTHVEVSCPCLSFIFSLLSYVIEVLDCNIKHLFGLLWVKTYHGVRLKVMLRMIFMVECIHDYCSFVV